MTDFRARWPAGRLGPSIEWPRWFAPAVLGVLLLVTLLLAYRQPLADRLWPNTRAEALRTQAAQALAQGRLSAPDGRGARELYQAALAIDPDRNDARVGLARVGEAALARARQALADGRFTEAHQQLQLARELSVPRTQADAVAAELRNRESKQIGIASLIAKAAAAREAGHLDDGPEAALPLYERVLVLQPDRVEALEGREDALADLLQQARRAVQRRELAQASALLASARRYDPGHADLPDTEARLAATLDRAHRQADADVRRGRLDEAAAGYRMLLQVDADDARAQRGLDRVGAEWARRAVRLAADFRFDAANAALAQARAVAPQSPAIEDASRRLARAHQAQARVGAPPLPADRARRVRQLLAEAAAAEARGQLLAPPGDSAFDKLRAARALAPQNLAVASASVRLLMVSRECFERELRGNRLAHAQACLDAWTTLGGADAASRAARQRLATRWLAVGEERLGAGEVIGAQRALLAARDLDPSTPGLDAFAERVRIASVGR
jgi:tetratricopeptide (TPR) repeat protein